MALISIYHPSLPALVGFSSSSLRDQRMANYFLEIVLIPSLCSSNKLWQIIRSLS